MITLIPPNSMKVDSRFRPNIKLGLIKNETTTGNLDCVSLPVVTGISHYPVVQSKISEDENRSLTRY